MEKAWEEGCGQEFIFTVGWVDGFFASGKFRFFFFFLVLDAERYL